jgi:hypothetical protein
MTPGKLGGKDEVANAYLLFLNTVIKPFQQNILDVFDCLLSINYEDITVGVKQQKLFDDGELHDEVVTGTDAEEGADTELETEIQKADVDAGGEIEETTDNPLD